MRRLFILPAAALVLLIVGVRAHAAEPYRIPCWLVQQALAAHSGDRRATRQAARARGYAEADIAEAERRCLRN